MLPGNFEDSHYRRLPAQFLGTLPLFRISLHPGPPQTTETAFRCQVKDQHVPLSPNIPHSVLQCMLTYLNTLVPYYLLSL